MSEPSSGHDYRLAQKYLASGLTEQAISALRRILALDPSDATAHALLSLCLIDTKRTHAALYEARQALALDPESALSHRALGAALVTHQKFKEAERHLSQARDLEPEDADA